MRTREEVKEEAISNFYGAGPNYGHGMAILEVLLDIRDLLQYPPIEISGSLKSREAEGV